MFEKFLFPARDHDATTSAALLVLRIVFGGLLAVHGWAKLTDFAATAAGFAPLGGAPAAALSVFAEFFCALGVAFGVLYRLALIPVIINMAVAYFVVHGARLTGAQSGETAFLYLAVFVALMATGPGRYAVDNIFAKKVL